MVVSLHTVDGFSAADECSAIAEDNQTKARKKILAKRARIVEMKVILAALS